MRGTLRARITAIVMVGAAVCAAGGSPLSPPLPASDFIGGINPFASADVGIYYNHAWFALPYTATVTFDIDRIEFVHGECNGVGSGTVLIQVREDSAGFPAAGVLTSGQHELVPQIGLQGADLPPVRLYAGTAYWIVLAPVVNSQASMGSLLYGGRIPYCYSDDGITWTPVPQSAYERWIALFYGTKIVGIEPSTWGGIKQLYGR